MIISRTLFYATGLALSLTACGGGGGSSSTAAEPVAITPSVSTPAASTAAVSSFSSLSPPASFSWSSQQGASSTRIVITQTSGANLGTVRVTVSNFIESDPTGSGAAIAPMSTDVLIFALGGSTVSPSATISFGQLTLPSGTQQVLVEVFSTADGSRLGGGKFSASGLLAGSAALAL